jgi:hypothetical protein
MDEKPEIHPEAAGQKDSSENELSSKPVQSVEIKQETPEMEVHHHPDLHHKPKPWKEYLLEGLMIFIAVMLGFIAENMRENITNRDHVRELTSQLAQDLKADIVELDGIYQAEAKIKNANDTLISLSQLALNRIDLERFVNLIIDSHSMWPFHPSSGAIAAIKNDLHLKQFSNSRIIDYISAYEGHIELLHTVQEITLQYQRSFIDPFLLRHVTAPNLRAAFDHKPLSSPEMRNLLPEDITQLGSDMVLIRINTDEIIRDNRWVKSDAEKLLEYLKKQYKVQ